MSGIKVYIASTLSNYERVNDIRDKLAARGVQVTYDWTIWANNRSTDPVVLRQVAIDEINGIMQADYILMIAPGRLGTHFEYGLAFGLQKQIVYLVDKYDGPDEPIMHLDDVLYMKDEAEAIDYIANTLPLIGSEPHLIEKLCSQVK